MQSAAEVDRDRASDSAGPASVGLVVIGRNEGPRLLRSLASLEPGGCPVVYVDSGSHDGSAAHARSLCNDVVELDPARPFSAARARNEGFERLRASYPSIEFAQFLDGDCSLDRGWLRTAAQHLRTDRRCAVVIGHLRELAPEASVYNRLCALEWRSAAGPVENFGALGGIMMVRAGVFSALGGFNAAVIAGEDSEFGVRVALAGQTIRKLDAPMAVHDADIRRFVQWWKRAVRAGHAIGQRSYLNGRGAARDCVRERRSAAVWGLLLPASALVLAVPTRGFSLLVLLLAFAVLGLRVFGYRRGRGDSVAEARLYASFNVVGKLAEGIGLLKFLCNRLAGRFRIIEYK